MVISDENEKFEARPIDDDVIALCCVMRKRVISEEMISFDITLTQLVSTHLVKMSTGEALGPQVPLIELV